MNDMKEMDDIDMYQKRMMTLNWSLFQEGQDSGMIVRNWSPKIQMYLEDKYATNIRIVFNIRI